ncbi:MAG: hypothetical protein CMP23_11555 [Rickettsiales bacterium]|nr:hypothetical protein [Rickettsiales bacterium]|tara:strand:- start:1606 stop:1842 length:237 start_codon:yes stop_codon:yes gene_type:complete
MKQNSHMGPVFKVPSQHLPCAIDFCSNGCVNLHFGPVVVHLRTADFLAVQQTASEVAAMIRSAELAEFSSTAEGGDFH